MAGVAIVVAYEMLIVWAVVVGVVVMTNGNVIRIRVFVSVLIVVGSA